MSKQLSLRGSGMNRGRGSVSGGNGSGGVREGLWFSFVVAHDGGFNFCFSGVFYWYWGSFHFGGGTGRWAIIPGGLDTFLILPNFLRSSVLSRSATRIYHIYK